MANYKTKGIIIKRSNFGEADRLLTIYTEKYGKVRAIAKGARKPTSRLGGNLEPFCSAYFVIAEGRNLDIVTEAEIIECFFALRNDLKSTHTSYYLAEVIDKLTEDNQKHPEVFTLLVKTLEKINSLPSGLVLPYFELNLAARLGYQPELFECLKCHQKISPGKNTFDFDGGGIVCPKCRSNGRVISNEAVKILRLFLQKNIEVVEKIKNCSPGLVKELRTITNDYLKHLHQQEFKSRRFVYE